jgi:hypothetical protein
MRNLILWPFPGCFVASRQRLTGIDRNACCEFATWNSNSVRVLSDQAAPVEFRMFLKSAIYAIIGTLCQGALSVEAADWAFRRSWFSHEPAMSRTSANPRMAYGMTSLPPQSLPTSRSAYRLATPQRGPGFSVRSKNRFNFYRLYNGQSYDTTIYREFSYEESP